MFVVGLRYPHHARHSGYDGFAHHLGVRVGAPLRARWFPGRAGRAVDRALATVVGQPNYSVGVMLSEAAAAAHMLRRAGGLYHVMYGERDLLLLRSLAGVRGNHMIATFHGPLAVPHAPLAWLPETVDAAILVSEYQRRYFESVLPEDRIFVARHGIDTGFFRPAAEAPANPVCISVGSHMRDFATLARTVRRIWRRSPAVRFVFVGLKWPGELGPLLDDDRVEVLSGLSDEDLRAAYRRARVALFAFRDVTASNALLEAMACGLPIVATDVGGVGEYAGPDAAKLCPPGDCEGLADAVLGLMSDPEGAERMGAASRATAVRHDYRAVAQEVRRVYARVLAA